MEITEVILSNGKEFYSLTMTGFIEVVPAKDKNGVLKFKPKKTKKK
jgi:hypothetical protein